MAKTEEKLTPAMKQFHHFKQKYPDAVLFFRMGDFYETFFEDAVIASQLLGLTLTSRNNGSASRIPLAGLPYHALDSYLARLIRAGKKVAICEQMEPPQKGKKVVRREVVQVVSPGTVLSDDLLEQKKNNYLVNILWKGKNYKEGMVVDIPSHVILKPGDSIITSGNSLIFPEGILVGTVNEYLQSINKDLSEATMIFSTEFNSLQHVYIIENQMKKEIDSLVSTQEK